MTTTRRGSIRRRDDTWIATIDVAPPGSPRRQQYRRFPTRREAVAWLDRTRRDLAEGGWYSPTDLTLLEYLTQWIATRGAAGLRPTTADSYRRTIEAYVAPSPIAHIKMHDLAAGHLDSLYAHLLSAGRRNGTGLSPRTVRYLHSILRKALGDAVRKRLLPRNPATDADPPRSSATRPPTVTVWTPRQLGTFLALCQGYHHGALFTLMATTGIRRGEACGLQWDDVDFDRQSIRVVRTRTTSDHEPIEGRPKSVRGIRTVSVDEDTMKVLREHRRAENESRLLLGPGWRGRGHVFTAPDGEPLHPDVVSQSFARLIARSALPRVRLHDLRHGHASILLAAGVNPKVVSERLGHSSVAFTLDTYAHLMPDDQERAATAAALFVTQAVNDER